jgi:hypothetical protein
MRDVVSSEHPPSQQGSYPYPPLQPQFKVLGMRAQTSTRSGDLFAGESTHRRENESCIYLPSASEYMMTSRTTEQQSSAYHQTRTTMTTVYRRCRRRTWGGRNGRCLLRPVKTVAGKMINASLSSSGGAQI